MSETRADFLDPEIPERSPCSDSDSLLASAAAAAPALDLEISPVEKPGAPARPWGPWATVGWTLVCIVVLFAAQIAGLILFVAFRIVTTDSMKFDDLATNGNVIVLATLLSTPATVGLVALLCWLRGYPIRDYLALYWPSTRSVAIALFGLAVLLGATDLTSFLLGRPLVPTVMVDVYRTGSLPGLVLAFVVLAPLGEETLFRGFLYKGIAASRAGPTAAIIVSSVAFASLHVQYDWYGIAGVAATGLYLGIVRFRTHSLFLTMLLHSIANVVATLEVILQVGWLK